MSKSRIELDADIAALTMPEAIAAVKGYGPATRITNPRVRKAIRDARSMPDSLGGIKVCLQVAKDAAARAARRAS